MVLEAKNTLLISSYSQYRTRSVMVAKERSDEKPVKCDVPQGSFLAPFLFFLYINEFPTIHNTAKLIIDVDDARLFSAGNYGTDLVNRGYEALSKINDLAA